MTTQRNARFWIYFAGSYVKLTLRPGQLATIHEGGPTDEGFSSEITIYRHEGDQIAREWDEWGSDCDGRYGRSGDSFCPLSDLSARENYEQGEPNLPEWQHGASSQYDQNAELAGY